VNSVKYCKAALKICVSLWLVFVSSLAFAEESKPKIVILGDSLSAGYQLAQGEGFPERLQAALKDEGLDVDIIGAGVSGDTTSGGLSRLDWSVPDGTDGVILELGANDALRGLPPKTTRENLDKMITRLKERGIEVLLAGMLAPPNMGETYEKEFNAIFPELSEKHNLLLYPFFLDGVLTKPELLLADGIHPNAKGVNVMTYRILPTVVSFVEVIRPSP
jgi:acyl-CoA thioesterase-1